jgi:hypothetical protein
MSLSSVRPITMAGLSSSNSRPANVVDSTTTRACATGCAAGATGGVTATAPLADGLGSVSDSCGIGSVTAPTNPDPSTAAASALLMRVVAIAESFGSTPTVSGTGVVACGSMRSIGIVRSLNVSALSCASDLSSMR